MHAGIDATKVSAGIRRLKTEAKKKATIDTKKWFSHQDTASDYSSVVKVAKLMEFWYQFGIHPTLQICFPRTTNCRENRKTAVRKGILFNRGCNSRNN